MSAIDVRGVPHALFGAVTRSRSRLEAADAAIRAPRSSGGRVGFVHLDSGVGSTTLAEHVSRIAAARREAPVLTVDVAGDAAGLARRLGVPATPPSDIRMLARTSADAEAGLVRAASGPFVLNPARPAQDAIGVWLDEAAPIARFFDVVFTDFGPRHPLVDLASASALCDVVCLVSAADRAPAELSVSIAAGLRALPEAPAVVLALVDRASTAGEAPRTVAAHASHPVVRIPADRGLAQGGPPATLAARVALLTLTAALLSPASTEVRS